MSIKSESLFPFTVSAIATSISIHKKARTTGTTNFKPFANTWNGSDNNVVDSHQSNTTYLIMADANEPNKLYFGAAEVLEGNDGNGAYIDKFLTTTFGASSFVNLIHEIEITSKEQHFTNLDIGTKIKRSPKAGSYINYIYEYIFTYFFILYVFDLLSSAIISIITPILVVLPNDTLTLDPILTFLLSEI